MTKIYEFKRDFYYKVKSDIEHTNVLFLIGPRKTGKTVCMHQVENDWDGDVQYIDFKDKESDDEKEEVIDNVINDINHNYDKLYLIDEITYACQPENAIERIANALSKRKAASLSKIYTKVIITGSQSIAIESWMYRSFAGNCGLVYTDFLTYKEWLAFENREDITEESYMDFLLHVHEFYEFEDNDEFQSLEKYLQGCLDETVISNQNTSNIIFGNHIDNLSVDILLTVLYTALFKLKDNNSKEAFIKENELGIVTGGYMSESVPKIKRSEIYRLISKSIFAKYNKFKMLSENTIEQAVLFLKRAGLLVVEPYMRDGKTELPNIDNDIIYHQGKIDFKNDLFETYIFCIKYPMFYIACLKDILRDKMPERIPRDLLERIVECQIRGQLPQNEAAEFRNEKQEEVDYVNIYHNLAVEVSIHNKTRNEVHFDKLPDICNNMQHILLSQDKYSRLTDNIVEVPYYQFIYDISNQDAYHIHITIDKIPYTNSRKDKSWQIVKDNVSALAYDVRNDKIADFLCQSYITEDNITEYIDEAIQLEECDAEVTDLLDRIEEARPEMNSIIQEIRNH